MNNLKIVCILSILIFLTSSLGFLREFYLAKTYGISADIDCFIVSFTIVSAIFFTFSTNTMQTIIIPPYQKLIQSADPKAGASLLNSCLKFMFFFFCVLLLIVFFVSSSYMAYIVPGFDEKNLNLTYEMTKIMLPLILVTGLSNFFISVSNSHGSFIVSAISQFLNNFFIVIFLISTGFLPKKYAAIENLAYVVVFSGTVSFFILFVSNLKYVQKWLAFGESKLFLAFIKNSSFLVLLTFMEQFVIIAQRNFGSLMDLGSISSLNYALKLILFPVSIISIALATVFFPRFIEIFNKKGKKNGSLDEIFNQGLFLNIYCLFPIALFFLMNAESIIEVLFLSQQFDGKAVQKTGKALYYYSFGLPFHGLFIYLNRFYLSCDQQKLFFKITSVCLIIYFFLSWIFSLYFGYYGISIATSTYIFMNVSFLMYFMKNFMEIDFRMVYIIKPILGMFMVYYFLPTPLMTNDFMGLLMQGIWTLMMFYTLLFITRDKIFTSLVSNFLIHPIMYWVRTKLRTLS